MLLPITTNTIENHPMNIQRTQTDLVSDQAKKAAMQEYIDGLNRKDLDAVVNLYAADARIEDPVGSTQIIEGSEAIRAFYAGSIAMDITLKLAAPIRGSHGNEAAMAFDVEIHKSEPPIVIRVIDVMTFNKDGKIQTMHAYWAPEDALPLKG